MNPFDIEKKIKDNALAKVAGVAAKDKESNPVVDALEEKFGLYKLWLIEPSGEEIGFVKIPKTIPIQEGAIVRSTSKKFYRIISPPIYDECDSFSGGRDYYVIKVIVQKIEPLYD